VNRTYRTFTDGSAIGNPGPGGRGAVVMQGKGRWEMSGAFPWTTISEMELFAALRALRSLPQRACVELYSDRASGPNPSRHACV
jgi:ribonuclease HI